MIRHPTASRSRRLGLSLPGIGALGRSERVAAALGARLDDGFHWFPDISPGGMERLDAVVVGPGGTWVLGYAEKRGRFRHRNGHWYRWNASTESWVPWDAVPVTGARVAGRRLSLYLERAALPAAVEVALVAPRGTDVSWDSAEEAHMFVTADAVELGARIARDDVLAQSQVDRIVALLDPRQPLPQLAPSSPRG
jgi:hypothetical protein